MGNFWLDYDRNHPAIPEPVLQKYATTVGDGVSSNFAISHGFGTMSVTVQCYDMRHMNSLIVPYSILDPNTIVLHFSSPPANSSVRVVIIG